MSRVAASITQADVVADAPQSVVYFVRIGKNVKIGVTTNLKRRMKAMQTYASDIKLLIEMPGDRSLEQKLHDLLAESRVARELFHQDYRVISFIDQFQYNGLERAIEFLEATTPAALKKAKEENFQKRVAAARQSKAEKDAYFASLVAERQRKLGW
jgi:hypothetical protein